MGHHLRFGQRFGHAAGAADDVGLPGLRAAALGHMHRRAQRQRLSNLVEQRLAVKRLGQVGENAALGGLDGVGNGTVRGQQNDGQRRMLGANLVKQRQPVLAGQAHVAQHQLGAFQLQLGQCRFCRGDGGDAVACRREPHGQQAQHVGVVIDNQQVQGGGLGGFGHGAGGRARLAGA